MIKKLSLLMASVLFLVACSSGSDPSDGSGPGPGPGPDPEPISKNLLTIVTESDLTQQNIADFVASDSNYTTFTFDDFHHIVIPPSKSCVFSQGNCDDFRLGDIDTETSSFYGAVEYDLTDITLNGKTICDNDMAFNRLRLYKDFTDKALGTTSFMLKDSTGDNLITHIPCSKKGNSHTIRLFMKEINDPSKARLCTMDTKNEAGECLGDAGSVVLFPNDGKQEQSVFILDIVGPNSLTLDMNALDSAYPDFPAYYFTRSSSKTTSAFTVLDEIDQDYFRSTTDPATSFVRYGIGETLYEDIMNHTPNERSLYLIDGNSICDNPFYVLLKQTSDILYHSLDAKKLEFPCSKLENINIPTTVYRMTMSEATQTDIENPSIVPSVKVCQIDPSNNQCFVNEALHSAVLSIEWMNSIGQTNHSLNMLDYRNDPLSLTPLITNTTPDLANLINKHGITLTDPINNSFSAYDLSKHCQAEDRYHIIISMDDLELDGKTYVTDDGSQLVFGLLCETDFPFTVAVNDLGNDHVEIITSKFDPILLRDQSIAPTEFFVAIVTVNENDNTIHNESPSGFLSMYYEPNTPNVDLGSSQLPIDTSSDPSGGYLYSDDTITYSQIQLIKLDYGLCSTSGNTIPISALQFNTSEGYWYQNSSDVLTCVSNFDLANGVKLPVLALRIPPYIFPPQPFAIGRELIIGGDPNSAAVELKELTSSFLPPGL